MNDWIELSASPLSTAAAVEFATDPAAGGIDLFLGTTRQEINGEGKSLLALDYEAYPEMAVSQMRDLAARARTQWAILKVVLLHRTGRVGLGEPSVIIAVSTAHRAASFEACRWIIDTLKTEVAVWKKEVWADGSTSWVPGHTIETPL